MVQSLLLILLVGAHPVSAPDTVVVCPEPLRDALRSWVTERSAEGHDIVVIRAASDPVEVRAAIRRWGRLGDLRSVVLVGDAAASADDPAGGACVPTWLVPATINVRWGSEPDIATDAPYGDLDGDGLPDVAVGRLPCDTPAQLERLVAKTLAYGKSRDHGLWRRRVNFVAGVGGFGPLTDRTVELAAAALIRQELPDAFSTSMTYASWTSPFCPHPRRFRAATLRRLNEGCLLWVYMGHGQVRSLDQTAPGHGPVLTAEDAGLLACRHGWPIAVFMCCYAGAFDAKWDCLAEQLVLAPGGPVAALAGSRVTMPYGMAALGTELLEQLFHGAPQTLGRVVMRAQRQLLAGDRRAGPRAALDQLAASLSPQPDTLDAERREHVLLFNLIGDPLLPLDLPEEVALQVPTEVPAGQAIPVMAESPIAGRATVELVRRLGRFRRSRRSDYDNSFAAMAAYREMYRRANDARLAAVSVEVLPGAFRTQLAAPAAASGTYCVRIFVDGADGHAAGAAVIRIRRPQDKKKGEGK